MKKNQEYYALIEVCARKKLGPFIIEWLALSLAFAISDGRLWIDFFLNSSLWSVHHPFIFIAALSAHNVIVGWKAA